MQKARKVTTRFPIESHLEADNIKRLSDLINGGGAYAPKVIERNGKFYFCAPVTHETIRGRAIGVAVADNPVGPFRDGIGSALITGEMINHEEEFVNIDPTVLIDDDGQAYIFWGKSQCYYAKLKSNMIELDGEITTVEFPNFEEGSHLHKRGDWYYFSYGTGRRKKSPTR